MAKISMNLDAFWEFHSWSAEKAHFEKSPFLGVQHQIMVLEHYINTHKAQNTF